MQYQVLIENNANQVYVASIIGMPDCVVEGQTKEEAIAKAKAALATRLARGEIVTIEIESSDIEHFNNPWLKNFGRFQNDPTFDDFLAEIEANRRISIEEESEE